MLTCINQEVLASQFTASSTTGCLEVRERGVMERPPLKASVCTFFGSNVFAALSSWAWGLKGGVKWENEAASLNLAVVPPWKLAGGCSHMIPTHPGRWRAKLAGVGVLNGGTGVWKEAILVPLAVHRRVFTMRLGVGPAC